MAAANELLPTVGRSLLLSANYVRLSADCSYGMRMANYRTQIAPTKFGLHYPAACVVGRLRRAARKEK